MRSITGACLAGIIGLMGCDSNSGITYYNKAPSVAILNPPDGSEYDEGEVVTLQAIVSDDSTDPEALIVYWSSDIDGELYSSIADANGRLEYSTSNLSPGNHTITLAATDLDAETETDFVSLVVYELEDVPTIEIEHPASGEYGYEGEEFEFVAEVSDEQDEPETLAVFVYSDLDGYLCDMDVDGVGVARCETLISGGDHQLTFTVEDSDGNTAEESGYFTVVGFEDQDVDGDGWTETQGDCDDDDDDVFPGQTEYYNGADDDCDDTIDEETNGYDDDLDGQAEIDGDCDDDDPDVYDGAPESCDYTDNDCDDIIDEGTDCYDDDGDGYTEDEGDCDDDDNYSYPDADELEDGVDNDCDGDTDEGTEVYDDDGDGYSEDDGDCDDYDADISPDADEECDGVDNDCDSQTDEEDADGCVDYYYDYDGDGYGSDSKSSKCLCSASGYYDVLNNSDCYDYNSSANPAQTGYYSTSRGDGDYDYDCDGSEDKYYTDVFSCSGAVWICTSHSDGWNGSVPSCGSSKTWYTSCSGTFTSCSGSSGSTLTQKCR